MRCTRFTRTLKMNRQAHTKNILSILNSGGKLTAAGYAYQFGSTKLTTRISELKKAGNLIIGENKQGKNGEIFKEYSIIINKNQ